MGSGTSPQLDESNFSTSNSWSTLPEDVAIRVLARLPVPHLLRARTVFKDWAFLTSTPEFLNLCNYQSSEPYLPVIISHTLIPNPFDQQGGNGVPFVFFGYDHMMGTWQQFPPLDFLPREPMVAVAAAEGLVCFESVPSYYLCNPVARTWVELPRIAYKWTPLSSVHIVVDHNMGSYRVIMLGKVRHAYNSESFQSVAIYESSTKAWRYSNVEHMVAFGRTSVLCGDIMYCGAVTRPSGELGVMGYDIRAEAWHEGLYKVSPPPDDRSDYQLTQVVECGGDVHMVLARGYGGVGLNGVVSSMNILKLEALTERSKDSPQGLKAWRQVACLCDELLEDLQKGWLDDDDSDAIVCVGHGSRICISAGIGFILMYNVETGCWSRLPPCPQLFDLGVDVIAEPFHFPVELRLTSRV